MVHRKGWDFTGLSTLKFLHFVCPSCLSSLCKQLCHYWYVGTTDSRGRQVSCPGSVQSCVQTDLPEEGCFTHGGALLCSASGNLKTCLLDITSCRGIMYKETLGCSFQRVTGIRKTQVNIRMLLPYVSSHSILPPPFSSFSFYFPALMLLDFRAISQTRD